MKSYITKGRSTPGKTQKNDKDISINGKQNGLKTRQSKKEVKDASDPSFDLSDNASFLELITS